MLTPETRFGSAATATQPLQDGGTWSPERDGEGQPDSQVRPGDAHAAVREALRDSDFVELVAQPILDLALGDAAGYELLTRLPAAWCIPPDLLFHTAHKLGVSADLHALVLGKAMRLRDSLPANTFITVNVDPLYLPDPRILHLLLAHDSLAGVIVEVTEHAWPADPAPVDAAIAQIRDHGGLIAADDVGAGYAGLNQLMRLRPDFVKIDKELVSALGHDPASEAMIAAVGQLSGSLNAWVIVEGVETEIQLAALNRLKVPLAQGYLLGRPATPWPGSASADLVRRGHAVSQLTGTVAALVRPVSHQYTRDQHGQYWRTGDQAPCLTLSPATPLRDAITRALSRPADRRWTPLLLTSNHGDVVGEVTLEDLVTAAVD